MDHRDTVVPSPYRPRRDPDQSVADIQRLPRRLDVAQPDEEIRVLEAGSNVQLRADRADHLEVAHQHCAAENQDVSPALQGAVVTRPAGAGEQRAADRRCRVRRVVAVPIRSRGHRGSRVQDAVGVQMPADAPCRRWPLLHLEPPARTADEQPDARALRTVTATVEKMRPEPVQRVAQCLAGGAGIGVLPRADGESHVTPGGTEHLIVRRAGRAGTCRTTRSPSSPAP